MTIEQTVEIPADGRLTFEIPPQKPASRAHVIIQFPVKEDAHAAQQKKDIGFGCLKGQIKMSDDFDEPLEDFKDYM
jgi:hypothetical protein